MKIPEQRILITGAAGGIGSQLALELAGKGAKLALVDRDAAKLVSLVRSVKELGGTAHAIACDLSAPGAAQQAVEEAMAAMGSVDILVNCAGIMHFGLFEELSPQAMETLWRINVLVPMQLARALLPHMMARRHGQIVNLGSIFGSIGFAYFTNYSASKFAMRGFSEALRREVDGYGITVTYVAPRYTKTPLNDGMVSRMAEAVGMNTDDPSLVARHVVRAIEQDRKDSYIGWPESLFVRINALLPRLVDGALRKQNSQARPFAMNKI